MRDLILGKLMRDFFSVSWKIPCDDRNLPIAGFSLLYQPLDLMNDMTDLTRWIGGLEKDDTVCSFTGIRSFCPITEQILLQPGKLRTPGKPAVFLFAKYNIRQFFHLILFRNLRQADCHLTAHVKQVLNPHFPVNTCRFVGRHRYINLLRVNQKQLRQPVLDRCKPCVAIQGNDTVSDQP